MTLQTQPELPRFGSRPVPAMYADINTLRAAIRAHDPVAAEAAWDRIEEHVDALYAWAARMPLPAAP